MTAAPEIRVATCSRGVDYALIGIGSESIVLNGLMVQGVSGGRPRRLKKALLSHQVTLAQLSAWQTSQWRTLVEQDEEVDERVRQALEMFHDVQTAASSIIRSAERLQASQDGHSDEEKFAALPRDAQTLVKAAGLLELRLRTMPIVTNPAAASYGNKIPKPIYRIIHTLVRTLQPLAQRKGVRLRLTGESHNIIPIFESFDLLPLTLIENAIKYSMTDQDIDVDVNDSGSTVSVVVSSFSPWIEPAERPRIFERRYRAKNAPIASPEGSGLGLYIAETVATAHSTHVLHDSDDTTTIVTGIRYCNNRFRFRIR